MTRILLAKQDGEVTILSDPNAEVLLIDWDSDDWSYDRCQMLIIDVLDSDLDGPAQFDLIEKVIAKFRAEFP